jgi:hypothetical protein
VFAAKVVATDGAKTGIEFIDQADYLARNREVFGRAAIANGVSSGRYK